MKSFGLCAALGAAGGAIAALFGGFDAGIATLLLFQCTDFMLGLTCAAVFGKSTKSAGGSLESRACFKGLCRKFGTLALIVVACRLDLLLGVSYVRDTVVICYLVNETISIVEKLALMGVPVPGVVRNALEVLKGGNKNDTL